MEGTASSKNVSALHEGSFGNEVLGDGCAEGDGLPAGEQGLEIKLSYRSAYSMAMGSEKPHCKSLTGPENMVNRVLTFKYPL